MHTHGTIWMHVINKMLSSRSQTQKSTCYMIPFIQSTEKAIYAVGSQGIVYHWWVVSSGRKYKGNFWGAGNRILLHNLSASDMGVFDLGKFIEPTMQFSAWVLYYHKAWRMHTHRVFRVGPWIAVGDRIIKGWSNCWR